MILQYLKLLKNVNFDKNRDKINKENRIGVELILFFYSMILVLNVLGNLGNLRGLRENRTLEAQIVYIIFALVMYLICPRKNRINYTVWIYLLEIPMLLITMIGGIVSKPAELTFTFLVFLLLFPLLIFDKPWRIAAFVVAMALLYGAIAHAVKVPDIFYRDMIHLTNIVLMTCSASIFFLLVRMRNIEYADYFAEMADEDPLTGLLNRSGARHRIDPAKPCIYIYLDLDRFKEINDTFGHEAGDQVLVDTAKLLRAKFRRDDLVIRLGGDEFAVYAPGKWGYEHVENKLTDLLQSVREMSYRAAVNKDYVPIPEEQSGQGSSISRDPDPQTQKSASSDPGGKNWDPEKFTMTASIGCAYAPNGCRSLEELVRVADHAMYQSKNSGKDRFAITSIE